LIRVKVATWSSPLSRGRRPINPPFSLLRRVESKLKKWPCGRWFPETVAIFEKDAKEPIVLISVTRFQENPPSTNLRDFGVVKGTSIIPFERRKRVVDADGRPVILAWDGEQAIPMSELARRIEDGSVQISPEYVEATERGRQLNRALWGSNEAPPHVYLNMPGIEKDASLWEPYLNRFIKVYNLTDEQATAGKGIHKDCLDSANNASDSSREMIYSEFRDRLTSLLTSEQRTRCN
jgi:hypothetical protein